MVDEIQVQAVPEVKPKAKRRFTKKELKTREGSCLSWLQTARVEKLKQKFATPSEQDGTRIFYETLLQEDPHSKMAIRYCLEHGLRTLDQVAHQEEEELPTQVSSTKRRISLLSSANVTLLT